MLCVRSVQKQNDMEYFTVQFDSYATFNQMKMKETDSQNEVKMLCQNDDSKGEEVKEIIFSLPTPENYNDEIAQFSISEKEARLLIDILRFHFEIKD